MNKVILVTGASSGIGKASAEKLIAEGHKVYVAARRTEKMRDLADKGATAVKMDITKQTDIDRLVEQIKSESGQLNVLVNNAGYAIYGAVEDTSIEDARRQFEVNIFGLAALTQKVLPLMREKKSGRIINVSSVGGKMYTPLGAWYHATKHALEGWSDCLRLEVKQFGIDVVIIEPGAIKTEFGDVMLKPMIERSGEGAYSKMVDTMARMVEETFGKPNSASPPSVIANTISKAISSSRPKTRYASGKQAKMILRMRRLLSDRMFDKAILGRLK